MWQAIGLAVSVLAKVAINLIFPPKPTEGPRLSDLRVQSASYGAGIPRIWGSARATGIVAWAPPLVERRNERGSGFKGAIKGVPGQINYTYFLNAQIIVCEGPITAITRIWAEGKLIYDASAGTLEAVTTSAGTGFLETLPPPFQTFFRPRGITEKYAGCVEIFLGGEDQQPSAYVQARLPAGEIAPGYRGRAYVLFKELPLQDFGARVPNFTFEVLQADAEIFPRVQYNNARTTGNYTPVAQAPYVFASENASGDLRVHKVNRITGDKVFTKVLDAPGWGASSNMSAHPRYGHLAVANVGSREVFIYDANTGLAMATLDLSTQLGSSPIGAVNWFTNIDEMGSELSYLGITGANSNVHFWKPFVVTATSLSPAEVIPPQGLAAPGIKGAEGHYFASNPIGGPCALITSYFAGSNAGGLIIFFYPWTFSFGVDPVFGDVVDLGTDLGLPQGTGAIETSDDPLSIVFDIATERWILITTRGIYRLSEDNRSIEQSYPLDLAGNGFSFPNVQAQEYINGELWVLYNDLKRLRTSDFTELFELDSAEDWGMGSSFNGAFVDKFNTGIFRFDDDLDGVMFLERTSRGQIPLSEIIESQAAEAGLQPGDIDASALDNVLVDGFIRKEPTPLRGLVDQLQQIFRFDVTEADFQLKFQQRTGTSLVTIPWDDVAAHMDGEAMPVRLAEPIRQEIEIPASVILRFIDPDKNYDQNAVEYKRGRGVTLSHETTTYEIPIVMTAAAAKKMVETAMYEMVTAAQELEFFVGAKYVRYGPGDTVTLRKVTDTGDTVEFLLRLDETEEGQGMIFRMHGALVAPHNYSPPAVVPAGGGGSYPGYGIPMRAPSLPVLENLPPLYDGSGGFDGGWWAGARPAFVGGFITWNAAVILQQLTSGAGFEKIATADDDPVMGITIEALPAPPGDRWCSWDYVTTFDVTLITRGTLESFTEEAVITTPGHNLCMVGQEMIRFQTATLVTGSTWRISKLLRGRQGTEQFRATHVAGEEFLLLDDMTPFERVGSITTRNVTGAYKAVSAQQDPSDAATVAFTNTSLGLKPWAPAHLEGARDGSNNLTITWEMRARTGGDWRSSVDVALAEADAAYKVEIMDGIYAVRTILVTGTDADDRETIYTAADQTADFGSPQPSVDIRISQLSATYGYGYVAEATV